jgi:hypothetical protein
MARAVFVQASQLHVCPPQPGHTGGPSVSGTRRKQTWQRAWVGRWVMTWADLCALRADLGAGECCPARTGWDPPVLRAVRRRRGPHALTDGEHAVGERRAARWS